MKITTVEPVQVTMTINKTHKPTWLLITPSFATIDPALRPVCATNTEAQSLDLLQDKLDAMAQELREYRRQRFGRES